MQDLSDTTTDGARTTIGATDTADIRQMAQWQQLQQLQDDDEEEEEGEGDGVTIHQNFNLHYMKITTCATLPQSIIDRR